MLKDIQGLHHITSIASDAPENNAFFTQTLGLRRVKKTVNFDYPEVYHLYYGDQAGTPGSVMTYFPFPKRAVGHQGVGEVGTSYFAIPTGTAPWWIDHLNAKGIKGTKGTLFGKDVAYFTAPDGDKFALVESDDARQSDWQVDEIGKEAAIKGFSGASFRLEETDATAELLNFMGYQEFDQQDNIRRFVIENGNGADVIDLEHLPGASQSTLGAGSVHHIAFAVEDRAAQLRVRKALMDTGYDVTPVLDRNYFWAIYFRTPGGILFEVATHEPGFDHDEDTANLGSALKLPRQHEHLREQLEKSLQPI